MKIIGLIESCIHARVDDKTGEALSAEIHAARLHAKISKLRKLAFTEYPTVLKDIVFCSTGELTQPATLARHMAPLCDEDIQKLAMKLGVLTDKDIVENKLLQRDFIVDLILFHFTKSERDLESINRLPLYPTEAILWDHDLIPSDAEDMRTDVFPLPKLNLQFLSVSDYLQRNFELYRLETAYQIRLDLMDAIKRMNPTENLKVNQRGALSTTTFNGWARMAAPIASFTMIEVGKPRIGQITPSRVTCSLEFDLSRFNDDVKEEWEGLREHDVVFIACIESPKRHYSNEPDSEPAVEQDLVHFKEIYGVRYIRGAEIYEIRDEEGVVLNDFNR